MLTMKRLLILLITYGIMMVGCGYAPTGHVKLPHRELVPGPRGWTVSVSVQEGDFRPLCMAPDAANDITCYFYYGYLESGMIMNPDGYLYMDGPTARQACSDATWMLGTLNSYNVRQACAIALMEYRWIEDNDYGVRDPNR